MKERVLQCFVCIFIVGFVVLSGVQQSKWTVKMVPVLSAADEEQAFANVLCSCVRIQGEGYYGSGNIYQIADEQMIIITNRHVLEHFGKDSYVTFFDGKCVAGEVLFLSDNYDLGFLAVDKTAFSEEGLAEYCCVSSSSEIYDTLEKNDGIFMVDIATDIYEPQKFSGEIMDSMKYLEDYGQEMLYGDSYAKEGMSGCGVFDVYGNYLATLSGGTSYNEIAAVPLKAIEAEYKKAKK